MPYILKTRAKEVREGSPPKTKGELTYMICWQMHRFLEARTKNYSRVGVSYQELSDAAASCSDAEHEFRRRLLDQYEEGKFQEDDSEDPFSALERLIG